MAIIQNFGTYCKETLGEYFYTTPHRRVIGTWKILMESKYTFDKSFYGEHECLMKD